VGDREALTGILFVLRTGVSWPDLPEEMGCGSGMTCLRRLREWQNRGVWQRIQSILERHLRQSRRIDWSRVERERAVGVNRRPRTGLNDRQGIAKATDFQVSMI
jgi:hypothetical protein